MINIIIITFVCFILIIYINSFYFQIKTLNILGRNRIKCILKIIFYAPASLLLLVILISIYFISFLTSSLYCSIKERRLVITCRNFEIIQLFREYIEAYKLLKYLKRKTGLNYFGTQEGKEFTYIYSIMKGNGVDKNTMMEIVDDYINKIENEENFDFEKWEKDISLYVIQGE